MRIGATFFDQKDDLKPFMYQEPFVYRASARRGLVRLGNPAERELRPRLDPVEHWTVTQRFRRASGTKGLLKLWRWQAQHCDLSEIEGR